MGKYALHMAFSNLTANVMSIAETAFGMALDEAKRMTARLAANSVMAFMPGGIVLVPALYLATGHPALKPYGWPCAIQPRRLHIYTQKTAFPGIIPEIHFYRL